VLLVYLGLEIESLEMDSEKIPVGEKGWKRENGILANGVVTCHHLFFISDLVSVFFLSTKKCYSGKMTSGIGWVYLKSATFKMTDVKQDEATDPIGQHMFECSQQSDIYAY